MRKKTTLKDIACFSKGSQINGDLLLDEGKYEYLNGGTKASGTWNEFNVNGKTITISEGGNSCGYVNFMKEKFWCGAHCYYLFDVKCKPKYLYYLLKGNQTNLMKLRSGACMPNIKKSDLGNFKFIIQILPPFHHSTKPLTLPNSYQFLYLKLQYQLKFHLLVDILPFHRQHLYIC